MNAQDKKKTKKAKINLLAFFDNDDSIIKIIDLCNLTLVNNWKTWKDQSGNFLFIRNNKTLAVSQASVKNLYKSFEVNDLYIKSHPSKISENSTYVVLSFIKQDDKNDFSVCNCWLFHTDGKLRFYTYIKNEWVENQPVLTSGIQLIKKCIELKDNNFAGKLSNKFGATNGKVVKSWAFSPPIKKKYTLDISLQVPILGVKILKDLKLIT